MKEFDFYQVAGVIAPGMVVVVGGVALFLPEQQTTVVSIANVSLGSLGVGLILAYVVGQLLQAVGNGVENVWWRLWGGMPTDWIRTGKHELVAPVQASLVQQQVKTSLKIDNLDLQVTTEKQWYSITRQIYAAVSAAGRAARIDILNGNYGLCRGVTAAFLVLLGATFVVRWRAWRIELVLAVLVALSLYRMHRFGVRYGRELLVQFLSIDSPRREDTQ